MSGQLYRNVVDKTPIVNKPRMDEEGQEADVDVVATKKKGRVRQDQTGAWRVSQTLHLGWDEFNLLRLEVHSGRDYVDKGEITEIMYIHY